MSDLFLLCPYCNARREIEEYTMEFTRFKPCKYCGGKAAMIYHRWWVCEMNDGGWFAVQTGSKPTGECLEFPADSDKGIPWSIAANSYHVVYGPARWDEAETFMKDVESAE
jgi:hypothetical protein